MQKLDTRIFDKCLFPIVAVIKAKILIFFTFYTFRQSCFHVFCCAVSNYQTTYNNELLFINSSCSTTLLLSSNETMKFALQNCVATLKFLPVPSNNSKEIIAKNISKMKKIL